MTTRFRSPPLLALALFATSALGACGGLTEYTPTTNRYGSINIDGSATSATAATANASAVFFEAVQAEVPNSASVQQQADACVFSNIPASSDGRGFEAGTPLALAVGSTSVTIPYDVTSARYAMPLTQRFSYVTGENASITVPGSANFPASAISVKLAEPVIPGAIAIPAAGSPLVVTWNGNNDATSAMLISVRYANPSTSAVANEQIFCSAKDDGRFEVIASALTALRASPASLRTITLTRFRTNETLLPDNRTLLHVATTVDTVLALP